MKNSGNENPFRGMVKMKALLTEGVVNQSYSAMDRLLKEAFNEVKTSKEKRQLFYMIIFHIGDIDRSHNLFRGNKVPSGGVGNRQNFMHIIKWLALNQPVMYEKFLYADLFRQFSSLDSIIAHRIKTVKGTKKIIEVVNQLENVDLYKMAVYLARIIKTANPVESMLLAKYLSRARVTSRVKIVKDKRMGSRPLQKATLEIMRKRIQLYHLLSKEMNWQVIDHPKGYTIFAGMNEWRKMYNRLNESAVFSENLYSIMDKDEFIAWIDSLPNGARFRVRNKLKDPFYKTYNEYYNAWEEYKKNKQKEVREVAAKIEELEESPITDKEKLAELKEQLKEAKKESKVNIKSLNFADIVTKMVKGEEQSELDIEAVVQQTQFEIPVLPIVDISGSMSGDKGLPYKVASLLATLIMLKNTSKDAKNLMLRFARDTEVLSDDGNIEALEGGRFTSSRSILIKGLLDPKLSFKDNVFRMSKILYPNGGSTNVSTIGSKILSWVKEKREFQDIRIEWIKNFKVILIISDGDFNNSYTAASSLKELKVILEKLGWEGVIAVWFVTPETKVSTVFDGIENVIPLFGFNPTNITNIFRNIGDMEVIDSYTELNSLFKNKRYELIKKMIN